MASDLVLTGCSTESSLAQLAQSVLDQAALVRDQILTQVQAVSTDDLQVSLDQMNALYDQAIAPAQNSAIATQVGLPPAQPTQSQDEARLEPLGLVLINGILWAKGNDSNIENFRHLFFAVGSDVGLFLQLVHWTDNLVVVQTKLTVQALPTSQANWTVEQARSALQNDAIEAVYPAGDGTTYVVVPTFLAVNKSAEQAAFEANIPESQIITQVFWLNSVDTTSARVNQLIALGLNPDEQSSVLTDQSVLSVAPTEVETNRVASDQTIATALSQMQLLNTRFSTTDAASKISLRSEILQSVTADQAILFEIERQVRFNPILISRPADMDDFLTLNTTADLPYMFASRRSVTSINFQIARNDLLNLITQAANIPAGSNTVSSILSNNPVATLDPDINQTNMALILNACSSNSLQKPGDLRYSDLQVSYLCLSSIQIRPDSTTISNTPVIGYAGYDSPSSTIFRQANLDATLGISALFAEIVNLAAPVSAVVAAAINVLVAMLKQLQAAINSVLAPLIAKTQTLVSQAEAFMSRHMSYFGTNTVANSILNCAIPSLSLSLPLLDALVPFLLGLQKQLKSFINQIAQIVSDFLSKLLCLPINFLNDLLKSSTSNLPLICTVDTFKLPQNLEDALSSLRNSFQVENSCYTNFGRNLLRLNATVTVLPAKVTNFQQSIACQQTPLNSQFTSAFRNDIDVSVGTGSLTASSAVQGTNPLTTIGSSLGGVGSSIPTTSASTINSLIPTRG